MSDYPMLISNKLHSFRNFFQRIYKIPLSDATDDRRKKKRDYPMQADNPLKSRTNFDRGVILRPLGKVGPSFCHSKFCIAASIWLFSKLSK